MIGCSASSCRCLTCHKPHCQHTSAFRAAANESGDQSSAIITICNNPIVTGIEWKREATAAKPGSEHRWPVQDLHLPMKPSKAPPPEIIRSGALEQAECCPNRHSWKLKMDSLRIYDSEGIEQQMDAQLAYQRCTGPCHCEKLPSLLQHGLIPAGAKAAVHQSLLLRYNIAT